MASATVAGLSTLGVLFGYAVETTAGTKPAAFTKLDRINSIGGISLDTEKIDASCLEDEVSRYVRGRQDSGGTWSVTFNLTDEVKTQIDAMMTAYDNRDDGKRMWFEVYAPEMANGFFVVAQPPKHIPMPEFSQNSLLTVEIVFTIEEYKGMLTAIEPTN